MARNRPSSTSSRTSRLSLWAFIIVVVCLVLRLLTKSQSDTEHSTLHQWLRENGLSFLTKTLEENNIHSIDKFLLLDFDAFMENSEMNAKQRKIFTKKVKELRSSAEQLIWWLEENGLGKYLQGFYQNGYIDIDIVKKRMDQYDMKNIIETMGGGLADYQVLVEAVEKLRGLSVVWLIVQTIWFLLGIIMLLFKWMFQLSLFFLGYFLIKRTILRRYRTLLAQQPGHVTFLQYLLGNFLDPSSCHVTWLWNGEITVGNTAKFILKLCKKNSILGYEISGKENILIEIHNCETTEEFIMERDFAAGKNTYCVTFHPKKARKYKISILVDGQNIAGSPFTKRFLPGPVDLSNITILNGINMVVVTKGVYYPLKVETRDKYNNLCETENKDLFKVHIKQVGSDAKIIDPELVIFPETEGGRNMLHIKVEEEGCFNSTVTYKEKPVPNGSYVIISLNETDAELVSKATMKNSWNQTWYEGFLLPSEYPVSQASPHIDGNVSDPNDVQKKCRKIYFYFSSRLLTIKEFYLKIIPFRLHTFRISPTTKIIFPEHEDQNLGHGQFILNDGIQPPVSFMSPKRSLILATFAKFLLRNIGGAESFEDKRQLFYRALQSHHSMEKFGNQYKKVDLKVDRENILESSYAATRNFSVSKWCRQFVLEFAGEEGCDAGGLTREWISVLCTALFDSRNQMFTQFNKDDKQALVYPNPARPSHLKLKYYEFAGRIVGKCIFESSCSAGRRLNVKARFMRSFLAQLIGLRVNYKYFETDDKQLYSTKIQYIQGVDPKDLDLFFSEEEYDRDGQIVKEVDLIPNGRTIPVTEQNKMQYLDCLAQYRLRTRVSGEIDAFLKGLNDLVPDNLLTMFSEQELELLICGTSDISVNDLKKHHKTFAVSPEFNKVMDWFWRTIALFNQEEIARLLQFTTGSSQLPAGGFSQLTPTFSFMSSPLKNVLPKAHTCFNQLVLPDYSTYEEFQHCLHLAITEGCEGFGFA